VVRSKIRTRRWLSWPEALGLVAAANAGAVLAAATLMRATDPRQFRSFGDAVWWAVSTITTVGYGDVVPVSAAGRIVGGVLMFVGIASFAVLTAIAASIIVVREVDEEERRTRVEERRLEATEQAVLARIEQLQASLLASSAPAHTERMSIADDCVDGGAGDQPAVRPILDGQHCGDERNADVDIVETSTRSTAGR
jgi:voltage-gated potassium channel